MNPSHAPESATPGDATSGRLIGYARVSTEDQTLRSQLDQLRSAGCTEIFHDVASGAKAERVGLEDALSALEEGDTLLVWRLDRLGRSLPHLVSLVSELRERGVHFRSLSDGAIDTTTASGELIFHLFAALAQFERALVSERTRVGLQAARARGRRGGRRPTTASDPKVVMAKTMHEQRQMPIDAICRTLGISRATFYRYLRL